MTFSDIRRTDREQVLSGVESSIQQGMTSESVGRYVTVAREYGTKYGISNLVEAWIQEGRQVFPSQEAARTWAETLP